MKQSRDKSRRTAENETSLLFPTQADWQAWLHKNHAKSEGVWLRIAKKIAGVPSVSYAEALDIALCYGWIDGQKRPGPEGFWLQRFTPRRSTSIWSAVNREKALSLIKRRTYGTRGGGGR